MKIKTTRLIKSLFAILALIIVTPASVSELRHAIRDQNLDKCTEIIEGNIKLIHARFSGLLDAPIMVVATYYDCPKQICEYFIKKGAKVNDKDNHDTTPLHNAALKKNEEVFRLLLENGANPTLKNDEGQTCLEVEGIDKAKYETLITQYATYNKKTFPWLKVMFTIILVTGIGTAVMLFLAKKKTPTTSAAQRRKRLKTTKNNPSSEASKRKKELLKQLFGDNKKRRKQSKS